MDSVGPRPRERGEVSRGGGGAGKGPFAKPPLSRVVFALQNQPSGLLGWAGQEAGGGPRWREQGFQLHSSRQGLLWGCPPGLRLGRRDL